MERFAGTYKVTYTLGWIFKLPVEAYVWAKEDGLYARVMGNTYELAPIRGKDGDFTVLGMPNSLVRFTLDKQGHVKKLYLDLPDYGILES